MPDALPLTGLFGKVPAHGDFVRRGLPTSFVAPWDAWLQRGMEAARERLGPRWAELWDSAPPWRFALPAGACGPDAVAGVMLPSQDMVGRRFPITLAALVARDAPAPDAAWFAVLEAAALAGRAGQADADALAAAIPDPGAELPEPPRVLPLLEPVDPPPSASDPLDILGDERSPVPSDAFLPSAAALSGATDDPVADGMSGPADPLGIFMADAPDDAGTAPPQPADDEDLLAIFADAVPRKASVAPPPRPSMATPDAPAPVPSDGTLAFLLGAGGADDASAASAVPDGDAVSLPDDALDPLAALIAAGETPLRAAVPAADAPPFVAADSRPVPMDADPMPAFETLPRAEAPPPPPGGGWWTGGGGWLPPSVRPVPALLSADDFASLLEADA